jgi:hypothetical protein
MAVVPATAESPWSRYLIVLYEYPAPQVADQREIDRGLFVISLPSLVHMKLQSYSDQDRVHLRDLIEVGLADRSMLSVLSPRLADRLDSLLKEFGQ